MGSDVSYNPTFHIENNRRIEAEARNENDKGGGVVWPGSGGGQPGCLGVLQADIAAGSSGNVKEGRIVGGAVTTIGSNFAAYNASVKGGKSGDVVWLFQILGQWVFVAGAAASGTAGNFVSVTAASGSLTCDGVYHNLDLATVVGGDAATAVAALIQPFGQPTAEVFVRYPSPPPGTPSIRIDPSTYPQVTVPCNAGVFQYASSAASLLLVCFGYWKPL
jgi:hypothetical protein